MPYRPPRFSFAVLALATLALATPLAVCGQGTRNPFPEPIAEGTESIAVGYREFAVLPDIAGEPARMMLLSDEPASGRLFVNDMRGALYTVSYDGRSVIRYLDLSDERWGVQVQSQGRERGFQSFAIHPQFGQPGTQGYGKIYTWTDTENLGPTPDFRPGGGERTHDTVLLEWTARNYLVTSYDGGPPRELFRIEQPFRNHNAGRAAFNPVARPGEADFGLLYLNLADGGSRGDPFDNAQNLGSVFGKMLRIDPLARNSTNAQYGVPASNPFAADDDPATLGEIYAYGLRNAQHLTWDRTTRRMFVSDMGQGTVEEVSVVTPGANFGWNLWEGSFRFARSGVLVENPRSDYDVTYPIVEYDQIDPLLQRQSAVTGLAVYREVEIPQLTGMLLFGDLPSGEMFAVPADDLPEGGQAPIRRVLFNEGSEVRTLLELIQAKNVVQGRDPATRADLRFHPASDGRIYLLNKADGTIRVLAR